MHETATKRDIITMAKRRKTEKSRQQKIAYIITVLILVIVSFILEETGIWNKLDTLLTGKTNIELEDGEVAAQVHFIDVEQGDCTLIISQNKTMLIDSGEAEHAATVLETFSDLGVVYLDYAVATHAHSDHMGSMAEIIESIPTENIIISQPSDDSAETEMYQNFLDSIEKSKADVIIAEPDYTFTLGATECRILSPFNVSSSEENNNSVVMHITAGSTSFLMTGDAEKAVETQLINEYDNIGADILKVGHHGSNTSSSSDFLKAVSPEVAVIPVGEGNKYGHPTEKTLTNLKKYTDNIYRTDKNGTVTFICTKDDYTVNTEK